MNSQGGKCPNLGFATSRSRIRDVKGDFSFSYFSFPEIQSLFHFCAVIVSTSLYEVHAGLPRGDVFR